jgi:hypothetical protein
MRERHVEEAAGLHLPDDLRPAVAGQFPMIFVMVISGANTLPYSGCCDYTLREKCRSLQEISFSQGAISYE